MRMATSPDGPELEDDLDPEYDFRSLRGVVRGYPGAVTLSGQDGDDAKNYRESQVERAIEEVGP
jgi:hypothetical protein